MLDNAKFAIDLIAELEELEAGAKRLAANAAKEKDLFKAGKTTKDREKYMREGEAYGLRCAINKIKEKADIRY